MNRAERRRAQRSMEYLIRIGIAGLQRVLNNRGFTESEKVAEQLEEYENENNPIKMFIEECGEEQIENESVSDVYAMYQVFCANNGMQCMAKNVFSKQINKRLGFETVVARVNGKVMRIFRKV